MDILSLSVITAESPSHGAEDHIEIAINGRPLRDLILDAEAQTKPPGERGSWRGDLCPLPRRTLASSREWLTPPADPRVGRWIAIYTCGCGIFGCGGFVARLSAFPDDVVVWSEFADVYWSQSAHWDDGEESPYPVWKRVALAQVGPFRFGYADYQRDVSSILS